MPIEQREMCINVNIPTLDWMFTSASWLISLQKHKSQFQSLATIHPWRTDGQTKRWQTRTVPEMPTVQL